MNELLPKKLSTPKLPNCWTCYDLGNYEVSTMSDGTQIPKWYYSEHRIEDRGKMYAENHKLDEIKIHREHCHKCHARFTAEHEKLVAIIEDQHTNQGAKLDAKAELSQLWGIKTLTKRVRA